MKFLRVCQEDNFRVGMYRGYGIKPTWACENLCWDHERHPMPYDDPGLTRHIKGWCAFHEANPNYLFAFPGVLELKKWIYDPSFYQHLQAEGFCPHWIEAEGYHGWYQSIFNPDTVTSVQMWKWEEL
jgi:hypothetical protein